MKQKIKTIGLLLALGCGYVSAQEQTLFVKKEHGVERELKSASNVWNIPTDEEVDFFTSNLEQRVVTVRALDVNFEGAGASVLIDQNVQEAQRFLETLHKLDEPVFMGQRANAVLKKGSTGRQVVLLRQALIHKFPDWTERIEQSERSDVFDTMLEQMVKEAQEQWGIAVDGIVSKQFYFNLYLTVSEKRQIVQKYIEQMRWILEDTSKGQYERTVVVNVPSFYLSAYGNGSVFQSVVIVGSESRKTPLGKMMMWGLKINPDWTPPLGIMGKDVLPALERGDTSVIRKKGLVITDGTGARVNPEELSGLSRQEIRQMGLRFRQPAGDSNALGQLKFETDSRENIYLHDTNDRGLFNKTHRALSSGCVRVKEWEQLALWSSGWDAQHLQGLLNKKATQISRINHKIPIYTIHEQVDYIDGKWVFFPSVY